MTRWLLPPIARGRVAALRSILYSFIFIDVFLTTAWVARHGDLPDALYHPLFIGRWLPLPTPGPLLVPVVQVALLICAALAATGRSPRLWGSLVFVLYLEWMFIAMSYGKVDHDRFAFLVALAVLPTAGTAAWGEDTADERAGWAIRCIQLAVVATYLLAVVAKFRFGGLAWLGGATLMRAVIRRGTDLGRMLEDQPGLLRAGQYLIILFELGSPALLGGGRVGRLYLIGAVAFHVVTWATIQIIFLPHLMCLLAFLPLEKLRLAARTPPSTPPFQGGNTGSDSVGVTRSGPLRIRAR